MKKMITSLGVTRAASYWYPTMLAEAAGNISESKAAELLGMNIEEYQQRRYDAIQAVLLNQSYSLNGKSVNRADLDKLNLMLGQLQAAIDDANNESTTVSYVSFNGF